MASRKDPQQVLKRLKQAHHIIGITLADMALEPMGEFAKEEGEHSLEKLLVNTQDDLRDAIGTVEAYIKTPRKLGADDLEDFAAPKQSSATSAQAPVEQAPALN